MSTVSGKRRELFVPGVKEIDEQDDVISQRLGDELGKAVSACHLGLGNMLCFIIGVAFATPSVGADLETRSE